MATGVVEWAARAPERAAFVDPERTLALEELEAALGSLAARLLDGAGPRTGGARSWLPVVVDRSLASPVGIHGAIRAGLEFTPVEAHAPREVVAQLFARLGHPTRAIVARPEYASMLPSGVEAVPVFGHDALGAAPPQPVEVDAPGFVLFTSGTTGHPKGVVQPWSMLDHRVEYTLRDGPQPDVGTWRDGFVQPFGFAPMVRAITQPAVGRTLCLADPNAMSFDDLLDFLATQRVDTLALPPSLSTSILRVADGRPRLPSVTLLRSGAEASDWALVAPLRKLIGPHVVIRAQYSSSEAGTIARSEIGPDDPLGTGRIPLGRLDRGIEVRLEPLDDDPSTTELLVAHPRSLGYLDDPELTARRYVTDERGVRWWRSGDVVDLGDDGIYRHHGRVDELVKIHGMFVAPSRVEDELRAIDGIGAAVVVAMPTTADKRALVAHVQVDDPRRSPEEVEAHLRVRLPRQLMPAILVRHDAFPRTDREKVDRRALSDTPLVRWRSSPARVPVVDVERWCLSEVRRIVGIDDIGPDDDLFEAGLDSLAVLELCAAFDDAGFEHVDPTQVLEARTCARLSATVERAVPPGSSTVVAMNRTGTKTPVFVLPGGGGTALKFRLLAEFVGPDQPLLVIEPRGMHRRGRLDRTVDAMAAHARDEAEARLGPDEPCLMIGYSASAPVAYEVLQRMHAAGRPVHLLLLDAAPTVGGPGARGRDPFRPQTVRIRNASRRELPAAVASSVRYRGFVAVATWYEWFPGKPRYTEVRYRAFLRILGRAARRYEPQPAAFPATIVHVGDDDLVERARAVISDLAVIEVGGDHHTMLQMPEVVNLAAAVAAWSDAAQAR